MREPRVMSARARSAAVGVLALLLAAPALAQSGAPAPSQEGERLYELRCAVCHGESGRGVSAAFPDLRDNERLGEVGPIVSAIRRGGGAMPPLPDLSAEQIASIVTYVRTAWENDFGSVGAEDVSALLGEGDAVPAASTIWDGVFSDAQARRGAALYEGPCGLCHGRRLNGAPDDPDMRSTPPLARATFLRRWDGRSLATLYEYIRATMPENSPGSLEDQEYIDLIAYMLEVSGAPAGEVELEPDSRTLAGVRIEQAR